jgi:two-component system sensor histidine kinase KdpD
LGLAICKGLIEAHGGRIWIERPGEPGARLAFALPVNEVPDEVGELPPMTATRSMKAG